MGVGKRVGLAMLSPHVSLISLVTGLGAISQSQADWEQLFGHQWGPRAYVLAKWIAAFCLSVTAAGGNLIPKSSLGPAVETEQEKPAKQDEI